jgi:YD repeat-containing protein
MILFDSAGARLAAGTSRELMSYDEVGNLTQVDLLDRDDSPAKGHARIVYEYDQLRRRVSASYFQGGGRPARLERDGQHTTYFEYDAFGNLQRMHYTDARGRRTRGYAHNYDKQWRLCRIWQATYDKGVLTGDGECIQ